MDAHSCQKCGQTTNNRGWCTACSRIHRIGVRERRRRRRENWRRPALAARRLTTKQYCALASAQNHRCAICGSTSSGIKTGVWCVDHDHRCCPADKSCLKCIRGLLCRSCNWTLGVVKDSTALLQNMIQYLENYERLKTGVR